MAISHQPLNSAQVAEDIQICINNIIDVSPDTANIIESKGIVLFNTPILITDSISLDAANIIEPNGVVLFNEY